MRFLFCEILNQKLELCFICFHGVKLHPNTWKTDPIFPNLCKGIACCSALSYWMHLIIIRQGQIWNNIVCPLRVQINFKWFHDRGKYMNFVRRKGVILADILLVIFKSFTSGTTFLFSTDTLQLERKPTKHNIVIRSQNDGLLEMFLIVRIYVPIWTIPNKWVKTEEGYQHYNVARMFQTGRPAVYCDSAVTPAASKAKTPCLM